MPNIKSAIKRVSVNEHKNTANHMVKSQMHTALRKFNAAVSANNVELASTLFPFASGAINNAQSKGVVTANAANHKKAQISVALDQLKKGIVVVKIDAKALKIAEQKAAGARKIAEEAAAKAARKVAKEEKAAEAAVAAKKPVKKAKKA